MFHLYRGGSKKRRKIRLNLAMLELRSDSMLYQYSLVRETLHLTGILLVLTSLFFNTLFLKFWLV